ncbi:MAG: citrate synthase [Bacillota bacterium]|uniref:Citrate synthase n=1 Tax=Virgibacillus salarius TaxID=447199 RepID=A0A941IAX1_9BACI|nr:MULTISPECIES: citrate synthase [Bacillaceae]NAZ08524.1 citrate synthase [Agaribacter marinus]MBR7795811.1 citrate synthase [Virgibacillus salarius]MCC2250182.1 citrate synthase [Virgibacillus sp. AGTR]QRZ17685.1 citrate synthase [Virgibacillus sp. AGTR]WBX78928.1 citrate synthase [Virgibacillus salarius]
MTATTKGLEGVVATQSSISSIIDDQLTYVGYKIDDLAENSSFEEIIYLLWNQKLPTKAELDAMKKELAANMELPDAVLNHLRSYDLSSVHPMAALRTAISLLGLYDEEADVMEREVNKKKAIRIQAKISTIVTAFARIRQGKDPIKPKKEYSYSENFLYMLNGVEPKDVEVEAINKAFVLHADHELNASTFTARVCVATLSDIYSGVTAAIGALKGPLHGGANEGVMKMLTEIGEEENAIPYIKKKLESKEKIMGMGHRVYRNGDPRAKFLKEMSRQLTELTGQPKWYNMSVKIEDYIKEHKGLPANVDFYSASVYHSLGIDHDLFTPIFAISRVSGWLAHILEQYDNNRLIRPRADYIGPKSPEYVAIDKR